MSEAMGLRVRINLIIAAVGLPALILAALAIDHASSSAARAAAMREAALLTASADTTARYVADRVAPLVSSSGQNDLVFVPAATPFYAVREEAVLLAAREPGVSLRRVVVDPVDASDRPDDWERGVIQRFRATRHPVPFTTERQGGDGSRLLLVTPLVFSSGICATCYVSRAAAPLGVLDVFGGDAGFDFRPGEIVGITIAAVPLRSATPWSSLAALLVLALALWAAFNMALHVLVLRPLAHVAAVAEQVSLGQSGIAEFETTNGAGEIGMVTRAFNRLRRSMESAIMLLDP